MTPRQLVSQVWPLVLLAVVGYLDYVTGPLLPFFPFYLFVLVVVSLRRRLVVAMVFGALAAAILFGVDLLSVPALRTSIYPYWRAIGHLLSFSLVTFTIPRLIDEHRRLTESQRELMHQRREINDLNTSLVQALENRADDRQREIHALIQEHSSDVRRLREVIEELRTGGVPGASSAGHSTDPHARGK